MRVEPAASVAGHVAVPGDKSISHRAVLLALAGEGETRIAGFGRSADTESTLAAARALGGTVYEHDDSVRVFGVGLRGLAEPAGPIDCGNAGTLMRLLPGLLVGQEGKRFELVGDESLSTRPMERVAEPLRRMGARIETADGHAPIRIEGGPLQPLTYELPVASAQVKSAILLAGLFARGGETTVLEPIPTRDHTERLLAAAGVEVKARPNSVSVWPAEALSLGEVDVPGDISSAAPLVVAATLIAGSELTLHGVNLNPRRLGFVSVLQKMGAKITVFNRRVIGGEPGGDLEVLPARLVGATIGPKEVPSLVDELPLFALAATYARGDTVVTGAEELRHKETDRIEAVVDGLRGLGGHIRATADGFVIRGVPSRLRGGSLDARGDHRIAMLGAIAGLASRDGVEVVGAETVAVSFPGFYDLLDSLRAPT